MWMAIAKSSRALVNGIEIGIAKMPLALQRAHADGRRAIFLGELDLRDASSTFMAGTTHE